MILIIESNYINLKEVGIKSDFIRFLKYLEESEKVRIEDDILHLENFCGYLTDNILVIPSKIKKSLESLKKESDFLTFFNFFFEKFLNYIIRELSKENIIYSTALANFPVDESKPVESKIFKLLLLLEKKDELINSVHFILSNSHKELLENEEYKNLGEVYIVNEDVLTDIISNPQFLYKTENGIIEDIYSPIKVLQYETEETFDTLENRFIKHFLKEIETVLSEDLEEFLYLKELREIKEEVEYVLQTDIFMEVGNLNYFPSNSQVLMKKAGYREIFNIYRLFHSSFIPQIFKNLDIAFSLKDIATLWEYYVLIEILKSLKKIYGNYETKINFEERTKQGTIYDYAVFEFEDGLKLYFQKSLYSYSRLEFRPDFIIEMNNKKYIFDAKFRIFEDNRKDILLNMHYYKDGLDAEFSIAVCYGEDNENLFFNKERNQLTIKINELIENSYNGIGYINLGLRKILTN
ncbi:DUF2357 domain-containing protein [Persephonella sp.]